MGILTKFFTKQEIEAIKDLENHIRDNQGKLKDSGTGQLPLWVVKCPSRSWRAMVSSRSASSAGFVISVVFSSMCVLLQW